MHIDNYNMLPDLLSLLTFWYCFTFTNGFWIVCIKQAQDEFSHRTGFQLFQKWNHWQKKKISEPWNNCTKLAHRCTHTVKLQCETNKCHRSDEIIYFVYISTILCIKASNILFFFFFNSPQLYRHILFFAGNTVIILIKHSIWSTLSVSISWTCCTMNIKRTTNNEI